MKPELSQEINFHFEGVSSDRLPVQEHHKWLINSLLRENQTSFVIQYIVMDDDSLLQINKEYLQHDYYTDIITFNNSESDDILEADIFISIDRVEDNAQTYNVSVMQETARVLIHGLLHLVGYNDKTNEEQVVMTKMEDKYLALHPNL